MRAATGLLLLVLLLSPAAAEDFSFDISRYAKKSYEFGGHVQAAAEYLRLNRDAAFGAAAHGSGGPGPESAVMLRQRGSVELAGLYRHDLFSLSGRLHAWVMNDDSRYRDDVQLYELYAETQPAPRLKFELGKRALRWGKGYAFNPVALLERPKDPADPELSREGFVMAAAEYVRSLQGSLQTFSLSAVVLPVTADLNTDFSPASDADNALNLAARLYLLYRDTDIDILARFGRSRPNAAGLGMARNLTPALAIHGEIAWFETRQVFLPSSGQARTTRSADAFDLLLGLRWLTATETTWFIEYYRNGAGYAHHEMESIYAHLRSAATTGAAPDTPIEDTVPVLPSGPQLMRDYLHLRSVQKDPFGALYWNTGLTAIINLQDHSASLIPELTYTGITDLELRARLVLLTGGMDTEFGERRNHWRGELRARYFF